MCPLHLPFFSILFLDGRRVGRGQEDYSDKQHRYLNSTMALLPLPRRRAHAACGISPPAALHVCLATMILFHFNCCFRFSALAGEGDMPTTFLRNCWWYTDAQHLPDGGMATCLTAAPHRHASASCLTLALPPPQLMPLLTPRGASKHARRRHPLSHLLSLRHSICDRDNSWRRCTALHTPLCERRGGGRTGMCASTSTFPPLLQLPAYLTPMPSSPCIHTYYPSHLYSLCTHTHRNLCHTTSYLASFYCAAILSSASLSGSASHMRLAFHAALNHGSINFLSWPVVVSVVLSSIFLVCLLSSSLCSWHFHGSWTSASGHGATRAAPTLPTTGCAAPCRATASAAALFSSAPLTACPHCTPMAQSCRCHAFERSCIDTEEDRGRSRQSHPPPPHLHTTSSHSPHLFFHALLHTSPHCPSLPHTSATFFSYICL